MKIIKLNDCKEIISGDKTYLREIFNPLKENLEVNYSLARAVIFGCDRSIPHSLKACEVLYILEGKGEIHLNGEIKMIEKGDTVYIPKNVEQYIVNNNEEPLELLAIVEPAWKKDLENVAK